MPVPSFDSLEDYQVYLEGLIKSNEPLNVTAEKLRDALSALYQSALTPDQYSGGDLATLDENGRIKNKVNQTITLEEPTSEVTTSGLVGYSLDEVLFYNGGIELRSSGNVNSLNSETGLVQFNQALSGTLIILSI